MREKTGECTVKAQHLTGKIRDFRDFSDFRIVPHSASLPCFFWLKPSPKVDFARFPCEMGKKETKEALERGVKLTTAVKDVKAGPTSKASKWRPPDIPLTTDVGGVGLTLGGLMKKEELTYADAVRVYLAYQDSLQKKSPKSSSSSRGSTASKGPTPKGSRASKAQECSSATWQQALPQECSFGPRWG